MLIEGVVKNSVAEELNIKKGDELVAFDGYNVVDILDYEYFSGQENFVMTIKTKDETIDYEIEKDFDEELGLELERELPVIQCKNNCIFCFVRQLPKTEKLRNTLLIRDDDYRHSFISGNYVTLTNVSEQEINRIIRLKFSPIYVSVHSTNDVLRNKLLGVKTAPNIMSQLKALYDGGITIHTQIVYCPNFNEDLESSISDLSLVAASLAIVPVGLTKDCNKALTPVDKDSANKVIDLVDKWQPVLLKKLGTRFVFAADEFYIKAKRAIPSYESYEDFGQIENGIGLLASFKNDFDYAIKQYNGKISKLSIATGKSAFEFINAHAQKLVKKFGGQINVYAIENNFFGENVTVAGLVVGRDILSQLTGKDLGEKLIIPRTMLKEFNEVFLDNMSLSDLSSSLGVKIMVADADGEGFVKAILNIKNTK